MQLATEAELTTIAQRESVYCNTPFAEALEGVHMAFQAAKAMGKGGVDSVEHILVEAKKAASGIPDLSIWETIRNSYSAGNKYASMPAHVAGYGAGYAIGAAVEPVVDALNVSLDILELTPVIGSVVTGGRSGFNKASDHYCFIKQKAVELKDRSVESFKNS